MLANDSNTGFQLAIGNSYNKTFIVNNDSRERLTTFIYEEKHFSLQGLNAVLAHDSNARLPLAIGILYNKTFKVNNDSRDRVTIFIYEE